MMNGTKVKKFLCILNETLPLENNKLIYVYDFLNMWTFYVDVVEINTEKIEDLPQTILTVGEVPETAPEKEFKAESLEEEDELNDEFDPFDDFDFNEY